jgi:hypothetical protein
VNAPLVAPLLQRTLCAVYRFYDAFFYPISDLTPPVTSPLSVSIPSLNWSALPSDDDFTYRFSAPTLTQVAPSGANLAVQVTSANGDYVSFEPIALTLPLPLSTPPQRSDFLIQRPLWPTVALRPGRAETAVHGRIWTAGAQPVADIKVEIWTGGTPLPPPGTPYTRSNANGDFLFRLPLLKGASGASATFAIQLAGGAIGVSPASVSIALGQTQIIEFQRV